MGPAEIHSRVASASGRTQGPISFAGCAVTASEVAEEAMKKGGTASPLALEGEGIFF